MSLKECFLFFCFFFEGGGGAEPVPRSKRCHNRKYLKESVEVHHGLSSRISICKFKGPVHITRNFVCFAKKSVNTKPFSMRMIFWTHQKFRKCHQTSKIPSTGFGGLQFFVGRENLLFFNRYPSTDNHIL